MRTVFHACPTLIAAAIALSTAATVAHAADGLITITGRVVAATCDIDGNGGGTPNFTVALESVSTSAFSKVGDMAGQQPFYIGLSGSTCTSARARINFEADNADVVTGDLKNTVAGGSNVQVRLTDLSNAQINVSNNDGSPWVDIVGNTARLDYRAHYVATNAATTAGAVTTQVRYSIVYQ